MGGNSNSSRCLESNLVSFSLFVPSEEDSHTVLLLLEGRVVGHVENSLVSEAIHIFHRHLHQLASEVNK